MALTDTIAHLTEDIKRLKQERNAIILAHYYQRPEVQDVADFIGDSLELSRRAAVAEADVIVFCGVHFMAETAAILSPQKTVLLPQDAGCPMADMVTVEALRLKKREEPDAMVISYVNTSAAVKAESDICCTSANALQVVRSVSSERPILFLPDRNLGKYVADKTGRQLLLWEGWCTTHDCLTPNDIRAAKDEHPQAVVMVHPECRPAVTAMADFVASTSGLCQYAQESQASEFIVGTEGGVMHQLRKLCPGKKFYLPSEQLICPGMKATTVDKVQAALKSMRPQIKVDPDIRRKAALSLERMLAIG